MMEFYTIGVYNSNESGFFNKLTINRIDTFCDIRQRRGVRGAKYSFVNNKKLQEKLSALNIRYTHILGLAPTKDIRDLQKKADCQKGELKRERNTLGQVFKYEYEKRVLRYFDFDSFLKKLDKLDAKKVAFFCVEEQAKACHRALVTDRLELEYGFKVTHL